MRKKHPLVLLLMMRSGGDLIGLNTYEELLQQAYDMGFDVREKPIVGFSGLTYKNRIAIRKSLPTTKEKASILAEEIAHGLTTVGNILDQNNTCNRKQEQKARRIGHNLMIRQSDLVDAAKAGCRNSYEVSEFLDVTEEFLSEAIDDFRKQYGPATIYDDYLIVYEPYFMIVDVKEGGEEFWQAYRNEP